MYTNVYRSLKWIIEKFMEKKSLTLKGLNELWHQGLPGRTAWNIQPAVLLLQSLQDIWISLDTFVYAVMHGLWRSATEKSGCAHGRHIFWPVFIQSAYGIKKCHSYFNILICMFHYVINQLTQLSTFHKSLRRYILL